jgi:hypothetical protein
VGECEWAADGALLYTRACATTLRPCTVHRHLPGTPSATDTVGEQLVPDASAAPVSFRVGHRQRTVWRNDALSSELLASVYEETAEERSVALSGTKDGRYVLVTVLATRAAQVRERASPSFAAHAGR